MVKTTIMLDGIPWTYFAVGSGQSLLIIPPFHSDIDRLMPIVRYLGKYFYVIVPEFPGIATSTPLGNGHTHTARTYARFMCAFVKELNLHDYLMLSLSLGTVIAIRMFEMGVPMPKKLIAYGAPYDARYIHPAPDQRLALFFYQFVKGNKPRAERFARNVLCNHALLTTVFGIRYLGQKNYLQIIRHQIHLTTTIHPRAWVELIDDIFSLKLSEEHLKFSVQTLLVYNKHDNILDVAQTAAGMKRIFPNAKTKIMLFGPHAPAGPISEENVKLWVSALLQKNITGAD